MKKLIRRLVRIWHAGDEPKAEAISLVVRGNGTVDVDDLICELVRRNQDGNLPL